MLGTITNTACIIAGSVVGSVLKKGIKDEYSDVLFTAMGLAAAGLGINSIVKNMPQSNYPVLFIVSLALGGLLGTILDIDGKFQGLTEKIQNKMGKSSGKRLGEGLTTGILLYCIGTLSILGPIQSALYGDNTFLFTNATLDLVTSMVLASTYGIGMILAAPVLFCWQGSIYLLATMLGDFMTTEIMTEISIVGGFLIFSSGLGILKIKEIKTLNMLPALLVPVLWFIGRSIIL
ncbi:MAG: DUF554 domain-containing protein [Firmicutes bacterium]|nr:DUF554 domain-containing protein [Bacillota bacterium]